MEVSTKSLRQPCFSWKNHKIYDGDKPIASFVADNRMGPIFHEVVLKPRGKPLIHWAIGWHSTWWVTATYLIDRISVKGKGSPKLEMEFISHTPDKHFSSKTYVVLTYDQKLRSYLYDTDSYLIVNTFPFADWADFVRKYPTQWAETVPLEFANVNPLNKAMWQTWIYKDVEGNWIKIPLQHLWLPGFYDIQFNRKQGIVGLFDSPDGNVIVELLGDTPANSKRNMLCWAAYDMHFTCTLNQHSRKYSARYRLFQCDYDSKYSRDIFSQAQCQAPSPEELEVYQLPRFTTNVVNNFTKAIDTTTNDQGAFWIPFGDISSSKWSKVGGYKKGGCIETENEMPVSASWQIFNHPFPPKVISGRKYVFSAYIKTRQLEGAGAYLFCEVEGSHYGSAKLTGDNNWTKIQIIVPAPSETGYMERLVLQHEGKGYSAFSNVSFAKLGDEDE